MERSTGCSSAMGKSVSSSVASRRSPIRLPLTCPTQLHVMRPHLAACRPPTHAVPHTPWSPGTALPAVPGWGIPGALPPTPQFVYGFRNPASAFPAVSGCGIPGALPSTPQFVYGCSNQLLLVTPSLLAVASGARHACVASQLGHRLAHMRIASNPPASGSQSSAMLLVKAQNCALAHQFDTAQTTRTAAPRRCSGRALRARYIADLPARRPSSRGSASAVPPSILRHPRNLGPRHDSQRPCSAKDHQGLGISVYRECLTSSLASPVEAQISSSRIPSSLWHMPVAVACRTQA